ncbi:hypothetical protein KYY02_23760 [Streptomyces pimonensis]|uniref:Uncharacterized protein n=1 Tax=Streptomyces pimonensis TaxID=2860288 RepID=A0ABV4J3Y8_9ACTN
MIDTTTPGPDIRLGDEPVPYPHADGAPTQDIGRQRLARTAPLRPVPPPCDRAGELRDG